jgi:hypothetical protein
MRILTPICLFPLAQADLSISPAFSHNQPDFNHRHVESALFFCIYITNQKFALIFSVISNISPYNFFMDTNLQELCFIAECF